MAKAPAQYFSNGMARMNTRAGITARVFGTKETIAALNKRIVTMKAAGMGGLLALATHIKYDMLTTPPLVPLDTGALRGAFKIIPEVTPMLNKVELGWPDSHITRTDPKTGKSESVPNYAVYVHEMTTPPYGPINWSLPGSGPKFFEAALKRSIPVARNIMAPFIKKGAGI